MRQKEKLLGRDVEIQCPGTSCTYSVSGPVRRTFLRTLIDPPTDQTVQFEFEHKHDINQTNPFP